MTFGRLLVVVMTKIVHLIKKFSKTTVQEIDLMIIWVQSFDNLYEGILTFFMVSNTAIWIDSPQFLTIKAFMYCYSWSAISSAGCWVVYRSPLLNTF